MRKVFDIMLQSGDLLVRATTLKIKKAIFHNNYINITVN